MPVGNIGAWEGGVCFDRRRVGCCCRTFGAGWRWRIGGVAELRFVAVVVAPGTAAAVAVAETKGFAQPESINQLWLLLNLSCWIVTCSGSACLKPTVSLLGSTDCT